MKKTLAAASLAFVACIPLIARSQQANQYPQLENLSREQLILVVNCLGGQPSRSVDTCVASVTQKIKIITPTGGQTVEAERPVLITWSGVTYDTLGVYLVNTSATSSTQYLGQVSGNQRSYNAMIPPLTPTGTYQIMLAGKNTAGIMSPVFTIKGKTEPANISAVIAPIAPNNPNITATSSTPVWAIDVTAKGADQSLQTIDLQVNSTVASSSMGTYTENPAVLIKTISVYADETLLTNIPVSSSTFAKDLSNTYYLRISGINAAIKLNQTKRIVVLFETNSRDLDRSVAIDGYGTNSLRTTVSTNGMSLYTSLDGASFTRNHVFKQTTVVQPEGTLTLSGAASSSTTTSQNIRINSYSGATKVPLVTFQAGAQTGDVRLTSLNYTVNGTQPTVLYLYEGNTLIASMASTVGIKSFANLSILIPKNTKKVYTIYGDYAAASGPSAKFVNTALTNNFTYLTSNGTSKYGNDTVVGPTLHFFPATANFTLTTAPSLTSRYVASSTGTTTILTSVFTMNVSANGGNISMLKSSDVDVLFKTATGGGVYSPIASSIVTIPNNDTADGSISTVTVTSILPIENVEQSGLYTASIDSIRWKSSVETSSNTQNWGLESFKTGSVQVYK